MIAFVKWAVRFIVWILLYYVINYKIFDVIFDESLISRQGFNSFVLFLSVALSFAMSFHGNMISFKNIKYHLYVAMALGIVPISIIILNWCINVLNMITPCVNAPLVKLIEWKLSISIDVLCGCDTLKGFGAGFFVITVVSVIMTIMYSYTWNTTYGDFDSHYNED